MIKWTVENWHKIIGVYLGYCSAWFLGWYLSINLETVADITSWFLPAGVRVGCLLLVNKKYWPVVVLAELTCTYTVSDIVHLYPINVSFAIGNYMPIIIYMSVIHQHLKTYPQVRFDSVHQVLHLFSWIGAGSLITGTIIISSLLFQGLVAQNQFLTTIALFMLGDFVGILLLVPIAFAIKFFMVLDKGLLTTKLDHRWSSLALVIVTLMIATILIVQSTVYYIKLFAFIPIIMFAFRNGWLGATFSIFSVNVIIVVASIMVGVFGGMLDTQLYLIAISMTGLLLGAAISGQRILNLELLNKSIDLSAANDRLISLMEKNRQLTRKLINIQEEERKNLSRELHDEIGQNITALKINVTILKNMATKTAMMPILESIEEIADITYESAYTLMQSLRPPVLDDFGLGEALVGRNNAFAQLLNKAEIQYLPIIKGDQELLNDETIIAIYRITQECINNSVKHSKATCVRLSLHINSSNVELTISDNGIGFDTKKRENRMGNFGLQGIEDRVIALGGKHTLISSQKGTKHTIIFQTQPL